MYSLVSMKTKLLIIESWAASRAILFLCLGPRVLVYKTELAATCSLEILSTPVFDPFIITFELSLATSLYASDIQLWQRSPSSEQAKGNLVPRIEA